MSSISSQVEPCKLRSRRHRNRALEALEEHAGERARKEFKASVAAMEEAVEYLRALGEADPGSTAPASDAEMELAEQLADCWGMLGGVHRAAGDLERAIESYDAGFVFEGSRRFGILNTYNRVNRLVVRVLRAPGLLDASAPPVPDLPEARGRTMLDLLLETRDEIRRQLGAGRKDRAWALADLMLVSVLGGEDGADAALRGLDESSANDPFPYHSTLKTVRELAERDLPCRDSLVSVGEALRSRLPEEMRGSPLAPDPVAGR
jgi:hypothetical protein